MLHSMPLYLKKKKRVSIYSSQALLLMHLDDEEAVRSAAGGIHPELQQ